jgi:Ca2+-binding EF-hand superfamily protein
MPGHLLARAADKDKNGDVTKEEWTALLASLKADENGVIDPKALGEALKQGMPADAPGRGANREADPAGLFDKDKSGKIELKDLNAFFAEMDKNKDGTLAKDEMPQPRRMGGGGFGGMMLVRVADADRSGDVTADEWKTLVAGITGEDGTVSTEKLAAMMPQRRGRGGGFGRGGQGGGQGANREAMLARALDHDQDGKATTKDLAAIFAELDKNKDGALSADEMPRRRGGRGFGRGPGRGQGPGGGPGSGGEDD